MVWLLNDAWAVLTTRAGSVGTFGTIQGTFGTIQGTFGTIQGIFGISIQGIFGISIQGIFGTVRGTYGIAPHHCRL
jgi:hypothetical protein